MKILAAALLLSVVVLPQEGDAAAAKARVSDLNRYEDGSCGGVLWDERGMLSFHLAFSDYRADLWIGATRSSREGARLVAPGSAEEKDVVRRLLAWSRIAFEDKERAKIEAADDVSHRDSEWSFDRYKEAAVVNRLAQYRRIRGATIVAVFRGRGTVLVSFKVRDGLGREQLVLFRAVTDGYGRPHLADAVEPVEEGSTTERWIVQAMHAYTEANVEEWLLDTVWSGAEIGLSTAPRDAADVLQTLFHYMSNTSPRLVQVFRLLDGGSVNAVFAGARGNRFDVYFDQEIDSKTNGRIKLSADGIGEPELLEFGSVAEEQLLMQLDAYLARHAEAVAADANDTKVIAERLANYRELRK